MRELSEQEIVRREKLDKLREEFKNSVDDYLLFLDGITELNNKR